MKPTSGVELAVRGSSPLVPVARGRSDVVMPTDVSGADVRGVVSGAG